MQKDRFVDDVLKLIKNKSAKNQIKTELEAHINDKIDYYIDIGYDEITAEQRAVEEMGSAEKIAPPLNELHKTKWYKFIPNILAVIYATGFIALSFGQYIIHNMFVYSVEGNTTHKLIVEFFSVVLLAMFLFFLCYARKNRSRFIAITLLATLICSAFVNEIFNSGIHTAILFEPALYSVAVISLYGFGSYVNCTLISNYLTHELSDFICIISNVLFVILLLLTALTLITIVREICMKSAKKLSFSYKISSKALTVLFAVNCIVISVGVGLGYANYDNRTNELLGERKMMIDQVFDLYTNPKSNAEQTLSSYYDGKTHLNYLPYGEDLYFNHDSNNYISYSIYQEEKLGLKAINFNSYPIYNFIDCEMPNSKELLSQAKLNMTLEEFKALGWYYYAVFVYYSEENTNTDYFTLYYFDREMHNSSFDFIYDENNNCYRLCRIEIMNEVKDAKEENATNVVKDYFASLNAHDYESVEKCLTENLKSRMMNTDNIKINFDTIKDCEFRSIDFSEFDVTNTDDYIKCRVKYKITYSNGYVPIGSKGETENLFILKKENGSLKIDNAGNFFTSNNVDKRVYTGRLL